MSTLRLVLAATALTTAFTASAAEPKPAASAPPSAMHANPFLQPSTLPYQLPPFDKITDDDFRPGFEQGMAEQRKEIDAIAHDPAAPTFENTIVAMERTGATLTRVEKAFGNLVVSNSDDEMEKIEAEMSPKLSAHQDAILLDSALFARVDAVWQKRDTLGLDAESLQLLDRYETMFVRAGAKLSDADKAELKKVNEEISSLQTQFRQNVLKATKDGAVVVDNKADLDGFSPEQIGAAAEAAKARGMEGKWLITLQNTTIQPALSSLKNRALREKIFKASVNRATSGDTDNRPVVAKMVTLRARKGALLGAKSWAAYSLAEETAGTPEAVNKMIGELAPAAVGRAKREAAEIQKLIDAEAAANHTAPFKVQPWDWDYYAEQVRKAKYAFDESEVKPYFEMEHVLQDGVFYAAHELYGVTFKERKDLPVYQKDVRTFEVFDADGSTIGLFIFDAFKRDNKQGGAWMDNYVDQSFLLGTKPVIVNNVNIAHAAPGEPQLLTFDEVTSMFHEFGHATNGLFSKAKYPLLSGTNTPRDFVEYPSQANEMWAREPSVLAHFAKHYKTGEPLPKALFDKVLAAQTFNEGYATTEYLAAAALDIAWHELPAAQIPAPAKVTAFDDAALKKIGLAYGPVPPRYHTTYFLHAFSGGYDAAYYAYIWSEVLARDTGYWFHTHGGISRANGDFYRAKILSRGRIEEPSVLFRNFFGGEPTIEPLLEYRGLAAPKGAGKVKAGTADKRAAKTGG